MVPRFFVICKEMGEKIQACKNTSFRTGDPSFNLLSELSQKKFVSFYK
jgi:hypothetical protein